MQAWDKCAILFFTRGCSSVVEHQPSKLDTRVRFPSPAPRQNKFHSITSLGGAERHSFRYICSSFQIRSHRLRICVLGEGFVPLRLLLLSNPKPEASDLCFGGGSCSAHPLKPEAEGFGFVLCAKTGGWASRWVYAKYSRVVWASRRIWARSSSTPENFRSSRRKRWNSTRTVWS